MSVARTLNLHRDVTQVVPLRYTDIQLVHVIEWHTDSQLAHEIPKTLSASGAQTLNWSMKPAASHKGSTQTLNLSA